MDPIVISKTFSTKAEATETPGEFVAIVSAFGNTDSQGDIVEKGAFEKTLAEWTVKGRPIPIVWSHQFADPYSILGKYTDSEETDDGLRMTGQLNLDFAKAAHVYELMKEGLIFEFSISGQVRDYELVDDDDEDAFWPAIRIKDIDLWEAGPTFKGANAETELLSVKSDGRLAGSARTLRKEGRVLARKHVEALREAHTQLGDIIAAVDTAETEPDDDDDDDADDQAAKTAAGENDPSPPGGDTGPAVLSLSVRALLELSQVTTEGGTSNGSEN